MENIRTSDSPYRFARLTELINEDLPIDVSKAASILRDHKGLQNTDLGLANEMAINQFIAHHSVIFQPEKRLMWVSTSPWQCGKYVAYDLNKIFKDTIDWQHEIYSSDLTIPEDKFIEAVEKTVKANMAYVPPYGTGATLYLRPLLIGVGDIIGVHPADEYIFTIFAMPVGNYFKGGLAPTNFLIQDDYDRAAPHGTGAAKVGGNYAASMLPGKIAHDRNFSDVIYLDPATHTKIEEVGSANFFGITADNEFVTPLSPSILPSITKFSLLYLAENRFGMKAIQGDVKISELDKFVEAGACGTAAVISPIGGVQHGDDFHVFYSETEVGPITRKLYDELTGIQFGDVEAPEGWIVKVD